MSVCVYRMSASDEALWTKLVRLAGGESDVVIRALSQPGRRVITLTEVIAFIETHRSAPAPAAA